MATSKPLTILIDPEFIDHPKIQEWREIGHTLVPFNNDGIDLVLSRKGWQWREDMWAYAEIALKQARSVRYVGPITEGSSTLRPKVSRGRAKKQVG